MTDRVELRSYFDAYGNGMKLTGAARELNQEMKLDDTTQVPFEALLPRTMEERADTNSTVTAGSYGRNLNEILRFVFKKSDMMSLGIDMVTVPAGSAVYPVVTTVPKGGMQAMHGSQDTEAFALSVEKIEPTRATVAMNYPIEATAAVYGEEYESSARETLAGVLTELVDEQFMNGSGTAPAVNGVLAKLTDPTAASAVATWDNFKNAVLDGLDGQYAWSEADLNILMGIDTYKLARGLYRTTTSAGNEDGINAMRALGATVNYSARIGKHSSSKNQYAIRQADPMGVVMPVWRSFSLIRDPYSNAQAGGVKLVAHVLFGLGYRRTAGWSQIDFKLTA